MKVSFIIPSYVADFYGESAFNLLHKLTKFESVVNKCDSSCDIIFCTAFVDDQMKKKYFKYRKKFPDKLFINYLWDLPFWRANDTSRMRISIFATLRDIFSVRVYPFTNKSWREQYEIYLKSGDILLSASNQTKNEVKRFYNLDSEVLYLYFPNIDIDNIEYNGEKKNQVIYAGRIEEYKRCDILIKALALIDNPPKLLLIGRGAKRDECLQLAKKLNVKVESPGYLSRLELIKEMKASLIFVSPSVMEGNCGWGPCEAIWAGIPSIVADIPDTREFFGDKGIYFKKDDPESLATKISMLLKNKELREKVQKDCRKQISFYTVEEGIKRMEEFIKNLSNFSKHSIRDKFGGD